MAGLIGQGAQGVFALTLGPLADMQERSGKERCVIYSDKGISVTESLEATIPSDEGAVTIVEPVSWRPEFARDGYPQVERSRTPTEGKLAITDRAALLLPMAGAASVRIPYELVQNVDIRQSDGVGARRYMVVNSCFGRFDIVTFLPRQPNSPDPDAAMTAAAQFKSRVAAFQAAGN